jgi:hypothetical protein
VVGENVTNQKIRCENLQKFKTFCLKLSAINFQPKLLAPFLNSPPIEPIYQNINSIYGKTSDLEFFWIYLDFIWVKFEFESNSNSNSSLNQKSKTLTSSLGRQPPKSAH